MKLPADRRLILAALLVVVAFVGAAVASDFGEAADPPGVPQPRVEADGRVGHGGETAPDAVKVRAVNLSDATAELLAALDPGQVILSAVVTASPRDYLVTDGLPGAGQPVPASGQWLEVAVRPGSGAQITVASWYAAVLAGSVRDAASAAGLGEVAGYSVVVRRPEGDRLWFSTRLDGSVVGQVFRPVDRPAISLRAASAGLTGISVETLTAGGQPIVVVHASAQAGLLRAFLAEGAPAVDRAVLGDPIAIEAYMIVINDSSGSPAAIVAGAGRTASGFSWVADYLACEPGASGGLGLTQPPERCR